MKRLVFKIKATLGIALMVCLEAMASPVDSNTIKFPTGIERKIDRFEVGEQGTQERHPEIDAIGLLEEGKTLFAIGQVAAAARAWQHAAVGFSQIDDRLNQARSLRYLAVAYFNLDRLVDAEDAIDRALSLLPQHPSVTEVQIQLLAQALNTRGNIQLSLGQPAAALSTWQQAEREYERMADEVGKLGSQIDRAKALQNLGLYPRSRTLLQQVLSQLQSQSDPSLEATGLRMLGEAMRAIGDLEASRQLLDRSVEIGKGLAATETLGQDELSATLLSLGNTLRALPDPAAAIKAYREAAATATSPLLQVQARLNHLSLLVNTKAETDILTLADRIQTEIDRLPPSRAAVYARVNFAESLFKRQTANSIDDGDGIPQNQTIAELLATAVQQARSLDDRTAESYAVGTLGKLYERSQQWQAAQQLTENALAISVGTGGETSAPEITARWQWQLGRILRQQGQTEPAIVAYLKATETLQFLRQDWVALNPDVQLGFTQEIEPIYREAIALLLDADPSQTRLQQAKDLIALLQRAELENFFREACWEGYSQPIDTIDDRAAIFYPIILPAVGEERLAVIVSLPGSPLFYYETRHPPGNITATIEKFQLYLNPIFFNEERDRLSQNLYDWLIRPAEPRLREGNIHTLVFSLDSVLQNVPTTALFDGDRYLVEQYSVAVAPGARLLDPEPLQAKHIKVLLGGLSKARQKFSALPAVATEVDRIADLLPSVILLDRALTADRLRQAIERFPFPIVHLATHGQFSSTATDTFLLMWDGQIRVKDLDTLLQQREFDRPIELLVLSACQTATGDQRAALGLAGMAVRSGARSTLGTLWQVSDASTAELMVRFYQQLVQQPDMSKAEALRSAQLFLLQQPEFQHPFFWSPYILVGNWL
jgi:CHAT domain-containing protein